MLGHLLDFGLLDAAGNDETSSEMSIRTFGKLVSGAFGFGFFGMFNVARNGEHVTAKKVKISARAQENYSQMKLRYF